MSAQMQSIFTNLARKFPETKFLKSISTLCIANFPDKDLPAVFVYKNGQLLKQFIGPMIFGSEKITIEGNVLSGVTFSLMLWHSCFHRSWMDNLYLRSYHYDDARRSSEEDESTVTQVLRAVWLRLWLAQFDAWFEKINIWMFICNNNQRYTLFIVSSSIYLMLNWSNIIINIRSIFKMEWVSSGGD